MQCKSIVLLYSTAMFGIIAMAQEQLAHVGPVASTPTLSFGMIGLGTTSIVRLNVVNLVRTPPPIMITQVPCKVELELYDSQGKLIKQKTVANLGYGQADFVDALRSDVAATGTHVGVSGVVKVGSNRSFFCNISATLEVFDSVSGATTAILANPNMSPAFISPLVVNVPSSRP